MQSMIDDKKDIAHGFGVGKNFNLDVAKHYHTHAHAFKHMLRCLDWLKPAKLKSYPYGFSNFDGAAETII